MANNRDRRVSKLEKSLGAGRDKIRVSVHWGEPGTVLDEDTGEYVTENEWRKRYPNDRLIIVSAWDDDDDD